VNKIAAQPDVATASLEKSTPSGVSPRRRSLVALAALLLFVASVNVLCMPATFYSGDPRVWLEETRAILQGHLAIDPAVVERFARAHAEPGQFFVHNDKSGLDYAKYGIANSLLAVPPVALQWLVEGQLTNPDRPNNLLVFNAYQIVLCLIECALLYLLTGLYTERRGTRVVYVLAVFYGTFFWYFQRAQSGEINQVILFTGLFLCLMKYLRALSAASSRVGRSERFALLGAWGLAALLVMCRLVFGLLLPGMLIVSGVVILRQPADERGKVVRREWPYLLVPPVLIVLLVGWVNAVKFGSPWLTGYHQWQAEQHLPAIGNFWHGLYGFLADMQGSMFWYFPVLIIALLGVPRFFRRYPVDSIAMWTLFGLPFIFLCMVPSWLGEWTYGPRYLLFGLPVLGLPFIATIDSLIEQPRRWLAWTAGGVMGAMLLYSAYLQERVNRLNFFTYYYIKGPVEKLSSTEIAHYLTQHYRGTICADLLSHRDNLDEFAVVKELKAENYPAESLANYKNRLAELARQSNYHWFQGGVSP
jgi:hypothetical protein